jgi:hypothetical protein
MVERIVLNCCVSDIDQIMDEVQHNIYMKNLSLQVISNVVKFENFPFHNLYSYQKYKVQTYCVKSFQSRI